ncbi:MAG: enoyl-CoA hydratase-related protein [Gemmatimonadota bacterium]
MPDSYEFLTVERQDRVAVVTVNRPDKLNALNDDTVGEIGAAFEDLRGDEAVGGVVLTGAGEKAFVAGADIGELARMGPLDGIATSRKGQAVLRTIETLGKPVVAAVNGFALGGGLEMALACHLRVASENARFGLPEVKLGIIPGYGGTIRLARLVGRGRALELILTGGMIDAAEAHRIGLANRLVPAGEARQAALELLGKILRNGPVALTMALEAVDAAYHGTTEDAQRLESNLFGLLAGTDDMREGMRAFLDKRAADFRGR